MDQRQQTGALLMAACLLAVIRLAGELITRSPKLRGVIADSVSLARSVMRELQRA